MEERLKFVARLLEGEKMTVVCREFGISRKTGYKIFNRYKEIGLDGLRIGNSTCLFHGPVWYGFLSCAPLATLAIGVNGRIERIAHAEGRD